MDELLGPPEVQAYQVMKGPHKGLRIIQLHKVYEDPPDFPVPVFSGRCVGTNIYPHHIIYHYNFWKSPETPEDLKKHIRHTPKQCQLIAYKLHDYMQ